MARTKQKKESKFGIRSSESATFAKTVQGQDTNTEKALEVLASIRLNEAERDFILNPSLHERVAENSQ